MKPDKKTRSDAKLRNLPRERQEEIFTRLTVQTPDWPDTSYAAVQKWLRQDGIQVGTTALSDFHASFPLSQTFERNAQTAEDIREQVRKEAPDLSDAELDAIGQRAFSLLSIREQDPEMFIKLRSALFNAEIEKKKLELRQASEERLRKKDAAAILKWQFDATKAALEHAETLKVLIADTSLTEDARMEQARLRLFGEAPK